MTPQKFRELVWKHYRAHGRHDLPWRTTTQPYRILVSEIMLQQTQVERVTPFYKSFLKRFPTVHALADAPLSEVLRVWQGLGYNRRAKMLHETAKAVVKEHKGKFPKTTEELLELPGIGPYTSRAVAAFAYNQDGIFIETNIRTAVTHHFFPGEEKVPDAALIPILEKAYPKGRAREWYAALMDYGSFLKRSGIRINNRSASYIKQATFRGSGREARGAILKELVRGPATKARLQGLLGDARREQMQIQLGKLLIEQLIQKVGAKYQLPS